MLLLSFFVSCLSARITNRRIKTLQLNWNPQTAGQFLKDSNHAYQKNVESPRTYTSTTYVYINWYFHGLELDCSNWFHVLQCITSLFFVGTSKILWIYGFTGDHSQHRPQKDIRNCANTTVLQNAPLVLTCEWFLPTPLLDCMAPRHTGEKCNDIGPIWVQPEHRKVLQGCEHTMYQQNASNHGEMMEPCHQLATCLSLIWCWLKQWRR